MKNKKPIEELYKLKNEYQDQQSTLILIHGHEKVTEASASIMKEIEDLGCKIYWLKKIIKDCEKMDDKHD